MKKRISIILLCLLVFFVVLPDAGAAGGSLVIDQAGLFTEKECAALEEQAFSLQQKYETDVVILTIHSLNGERPQDYADAFFDENGYGYGEDRTGLLFLLAMESRDWYISTHGDAIFAVTDYGIQQLGNAAINGGLSRGDYYNAFCAYLSELARYLDAFQRGSPIDGYANTSGSYYHGDQDDVVHYEQDSSPSVLLSVIIGFIPALITVLIMRSGMNTQRKQRNASYYIQKDSYHLNTLQDMFLYSTVSKTAKPQNTGKSGGGSSVHRSSGGSSHGGGGGKF